MNAATGTHCFFHIHNFKAFRLNIHSAVRSAQLPAKVSAFFRNTFLLLRRILLFPGPADQQMDLIIENGKSKYLNLLCYLPLEDKIKEFSLIPLISENFRLGFQTNVIDLRIYE